VDKLVVFKDKRIRRVLHNHEWWFVIDDIVFALTDSRDPKQYIQRMKQRDTNLKKGWVQIVHTLNVETGGGNQAMLCANTEGIFRIVQSIPSSKAEPFKKWLAKVGYERIQEIEDPELAQKRTRTLYKAKGYTDDWIEKRMRAINIREELTDEWVQRGIKEHNDFAILTAEIHDATFGLKPSEHKKIKNLQRENLRDHMSDLELIFSMLGEASTTEITRNKNAQGFEEIEKAAKLGGGIAGSARKKLEIESGKQIVTNKNYLVKKIKKQDVG